MRLEMTSETKAAPTMEVGIDWLTATSDTEPAMGLMDDLWRWVVSTEDVPGRYQMPAKWMGYEGTRIEHGFYGERDKSVLIRLSGPLAFFYSKPFLEVGGRPSRLDLAVTGPLLNVPGALQALFHMAVTHQPAQGRPPSIKGIINRARHLEGFYIGRRSSEVMLRIYDKGLESRAQEYKNCLRVEVELKSQMARRYGGALVAAKSERLFIAGAVQGLSRQRGLTLPFNLSCEDVMLDHPSYTTTLEQKAGWLRTQVAPTIQALIDEIGWAQVALILFGDTQKQGRGYNEPGDPEIV